MGSEAQEKAAQKNKQDKQLQSPPQGQE